MEGTLDVDKRNMNLIERLISEVSIRPMLWNKYHNDYNNRIAMDYEWDKIALILKKDKDFVKQKWRNLRDQYQRESKKVKVPFDNPTKPYIQYYRGKWIYFEHLLFLRDITSKTPGNCYSPPQEIEIHDDDIIKEEILVFDDDMFAEEVSNTENFDEAQTAVSQDDSHRIHIHPKIEIVEDSSNEAVENGIKRKASESREPPIPPKIIRPSINEASSSREDSNEIDDDLHFVKSLVPFLRKLSPIRKLLVRNEIQNLLIRESLCETCKFSKNTCHDSHNRYE